jgi:hypothetical protein
MIVGRPVFFEAPDMSRLDAERLRSVNAAGNGPRTDALHPGV